MKRLIISFTLLLFASYLFADNNQTAIVLGHKGTGHGEYFDPADKPEAYYDGDNQEIILVGDGFASYYDVSIISVSTMSLMHYEQVSGYGGSIDISSLPDDNYKIVIATPYNNVYEGYFTNY